MASEAGRPATIIDVDGSILGRAASVIAKRLLLGEKIDVINADKALVSVHSGEKYAEKSTRGGRDWGPYWPKNPALWFKRVVRGMVPRKITRGKNALMRFRAYEGIPAKLAGSAAEKIQLKTRESVHKYATLKEFALGNLGHKPSRFNRSKVQ